MNIGSDESKICGISVENCDIETTNGPAIFGGAANVEIINSTITAQAKVSDPNRGAVIGIHPN